MKIFTVTFVSIFFVMVSGCSITIQNKAKNNIETSNYAKKAEYPVRHIALFLDGTGNDRDSRTNVNRIHETIRNQDRPDIITYYDNGVGSGSFLDEVSGGALGIGFTENVRQAYEFLADNYRKGDKVYLFGFSRGAYTARVLSSLIYYAGLLDTKNDVFKDNELAYGEEEYHKNRVSNAIKDIYTIFEDFDGQTDETLKEKKEKFDSLMEAEEKLHNSDDIDVFDKRNTSYYPMRRVTIDVIGVWDTVESLGLDVVTRALDNVYRPDSAGFEESCRKRHHHNYDTSAFPNIKNIFHAVAIDEKRALFWPVLYKWRCNKTLPIPPDTQVKEVWFSGVHSDVGGGYDKTKELAGISLNWMIENIIGFTTSTEANLCKSASKCNGILPSTGYVVHEDSLAKMNASWEKGAYEYSTAYERIIPKGSVIHPSVARRYSACKLPRTEAKNSPREPTGIYRPAQFSCVDMQKVSKTQPLIYPGIEAGQCKRAGFEMCPEAYQRVDKDCDHKNDLLVSIKPFEVSQSRKLNANDACYATGLYLEKGIKYVIDTKSTELKDASIRVKYGADGFKAEDIKAFNTRKAMHAYRSEKRVKQRNWFSLVGALYKKNNSGYHFNLGKNSTFTAPVSGRLFFYLNDAPTYYYNNKGIVDITLKKASQIQHAQKNN